VLHFGTRRPPPHVGARRPSGRGDVAQLGEHRVRIAGVRGSSPLISTTPSAFAGTAERRAQLTRIHNALPEASGAVDRRSGHDRTVDASDLGLLVLRLAVGLTFAAHGAQKAFGWWNGPGWAGWQNAIGRMGFRPVELFAVVSVGAELIGGLLLALGLATPLVAAVLVAQSTVIVLKAHAPKGFWNRDGGFEYPLVLGIAAFAIGLTGPGPLSLDAATSTAAADSVRIVLMIAGLLAGLLAASLAGATASTDNKGPAAHSR
jgi:putative oxidoreductase